MEASMNSRFAFLPMGFLLLVAVVGCGGRQSVCNEETGKPIQVLTFSTVQPAEIDAGSGQSPQIVQVAGRPMQVDKVVAGPLCNDHWSGTVYVSCNVQVLAWQDQPTFLKDCNLEIDPGTIVYVASHNDTAYYNGCSCHITGATPNP
jgi:hypothetical protein